MHIAIIGAGPVGLWTAIQIKKRSPDAQVTLFERYDEYKRHHVVSIQRSSLFFGASPHHDEHDQRLFHEMLGYTRNQLRSRPMNRLFVPTSAIESSLKKCALALGCAIVVRHIASLDDICDLYPDVEQIVIANGAHSTLRKQLLGEDDVHSESLQYVVEMKTYVSEEVADSMETGMVARRIASRLKTMTFEYRGRPKSGRVGITLRFFVDKEGFDALGEASFKQPHIGINGLPEELAQDVRVYWTMHGLDEGMLETLSFSKLQLSVYHATRFADSYRGKPCFLVGDAAMGVPYFRALNSGWVMGSRLAHLIGMGAGSEKTVRRYNAYGKVHQSAEFALAKQKNGLLNRYADLRKLYRRLKVGGKQQREMVL